MNKLDFKTFLDKQKDTYTGFKNSRETVLKEGLNQNPYKGKGSYFIAFRPRVHDREIIETAASGILEIIPSAVPYNASNIHITITDIGQKENFTPDMEMLDRLTNIVLASMKNIRKPEINYQGWLINKDAVIIKGIPNMEFLEAAYIIQENGRKEGLELRLPWGAHITTARFDEAITPGYQVDILVKYVDNISKIGKIAPFCIDVGCGIFYNDSPDFTFRMKKRFNFDRKY